MWQVVFPNLWAAQNELVVESFFHSCTRDLKQLDIFQEIDF